MGIIYGSKLLRHAPEKNVINEGLPDIAAKDGDGSCGGVVSYGAGAACVGVVANCHLAAVDEHVAHEHNRLNVVVRLAATCIVNCNSSCAGICSKC